MFKLIKRKIADLFRRIKRIKYLQEENERLQSFVYSKGLQGEYDTFYFQKEISRAVGIPVNYLFGERDKDERQG